MKDKFLHNIIPLNKLIGLVVLIICILISKSLYLILFISTFLLILCILSKTKFIDYIRYIKKYWTVLLIAFIISLFIVKNLTFLKLLIIIYKEIIVFLSMILFSRSVNFDEFNTALYTILKPIKFIDSKQISIDLTYSFCFIKYWFDSKENISKLQDFNGYKSFSMKKYIVPRILNLSERMNLLKKKNIINSYIVKYEKVNLNSKIILMVIVIFLVLCIFKEVIL